MKQEFRSIKAAEPAEVPQHVVSDPKITAASPAEGPETPAYDVLLRCLIAITTWHDRPASEDELTSGLPLHNGNLTPDLTVRAANRGGYAAQIIRKPLNRLNPLVFPAILLLENGDACVAFRKKGRRKLEIFDPHTETMTTVSLASLKQSYAGTVRLVGTETENILAAARELLDDPLTYEKMARAVNPYGDGHAAERIVTILEESSSVPLNEVTPNAGARH